MKVLFGTMLHIAFSENILESAFGSFWTWCFVVLAASAVYHGVLELVGRLRSSKWE